MYCNSCGQTIPEGTVNCPFCGTPVGATLSSETIKTEPINSGQQPETTFVPPREILEGSGTDDGKNLAEVPKPRKEMPRKEMPRKEMPRKEMPRKENPKKSSSGGFGSSTNQKQSSGISPAMIVALVLVVLAVLAFPLMRILGIELPFGKPKPASEPVAAVESEDPQAETENDHSDHETSGEAETKPEETTPVTSANVFPNPAVDEAIAKYFNVSSTSELSSSQFGEIEEMEISTYDISINGKTFDISSQLGDVDIFEITDQLTGLKTLSINGARTVSASAKGNINLTELTITNSGVVDNLNGIENAGNLKTLTIHDTDLTSLKYIADCDSLTKLNASNNKINDIESLRDTDQITSITLYGNKIKDYTALSKIKTVNVWGSGFNKDDPNSCIISGKPDAYCFTPLITNLHMRSEPSTSSTILIRHIPQQYYIILDVKNSGGYTWYKVGNENWVADNGNWLKFYNN